LSAVAALSTNGMISRTGAGTAAVRTLTAGTGITITNGDGVGGNPTISQTSYVSSVQGNTGAVIVSVPVTSVQGATGAVIVTNIGGNAATANNASTASAVAWTNVQGRPTALNQFTNNLGNYGSFFDAVSNCGTGGNTSFSAISGTLARSGNTVVLNINCNCRC
jgi:PKD repeat protein